MNDRSAPPPLSPEDASLFETLSPDLARALYPDQSTPEFRITMVYPELSGEAASDGRALTDAATTHEIDEGGTDGAPMHRTTFSLRQIEEFHALYHLVESTEGAARIELLLDDKQVPLARELWLPLLWTLRT